MKPVFKRVLFYFLKAVIVLVVAIHFILFLFSVSYFGTTILLYLFMGYLIFKIIPNTTEKQKNIRFGVVVSLLMLFFVDNSLKYVFRLNRSYHEMNGNMFYISPYLHNKIKNKLGLLGPNPDVWYQREGKAGTSRIEEKKEFTYVHQYNSFGLRGKEPDNSSKSYKILALGDSFTEGVGVPEDSTWVHVLANKVATYRSEKVTYLNGGLSGSDPFLSYYVMKKVTRKFTPDLVVLMINSSDISDYYNVGGKERFDPNYRWNKNSGPWWEPFYATSFIVRACIHTFTDLDFNFRNHSDRIQSEQKAETAIYQHLVNDFKPFCDSIGASFFVCAVPREFEYIERKFYFESYPQLLKNKIPYDHFYNDIEDFKNNERLSFRDIYWNEDMHFNSKGYEKVADLIFENTKPFITKKQEN